MSPRRSSRARSSQNPPQPPTHTNSSSSVTTTVKENRSTRSNNTNTRTASPMRRASTTRSESIEDADAASRTADGTTAPRRSRRGEADNTTTMNGNEKKDVKPLEDEEEEVEETLEEDITRCICGRPEYPGPGASVKEQLPVGLPVSDDVGNFFVQCDKCHVWQHGGCMGLTDESMLPEEYYCEICKPELHKTVKAANGAKSSRYLPVLEGAISEGSSPLSSAGDPPRKGNAKSNSLESTKRRATMNSRGAYDEDEMLRRAIEESKEMGSLKRSRDDSDDQKQDLKRQRTLSSVSSLGSHRSQSPLPMTEDAASGLAVSNGKNGNNKLRGVVAKNNKEKELRDKQKEALASQRAEAASKRNARSERRRADDSPPPSPMLSPNKPTASFIIKPNTITKDSTPPSKPSASRKGGRPPARRGRLGRNQYTRDLPVNGDTSDSPLRDTSRDPQAVDSPRHHVTGHKDGINGESGRSSKAKTHPARTSMNEMKRRVAAILEFVGRMQTERGSGTKTNSSSGSGSSSLKGNSTPNGSNSAANLPTASLVKAVVEGLEDASSHKSKAVGDGSEDTVMKIELIPGKTFEAMNSTEMMDTLTSELVKWQSVWGIYGRS